MSPNLEKSHIERLREGDLISFKWLYNHYHKKVYGYCLKLVKDYPIAEEITEDVFVKLWERRNIIDASIPLGPLLFKITKDFVWNYLKKRTRKAALKQQFIAEQKQSFQPQTEQHLIYQDYLNFAEDAISKLPTKRQKIFNLRYKRGLNNQEIAQIQNISETTVRVHLMKAQRFLRDHLKAHPNFVILMLLLS